MKHTIKLLTMAFTLAAILTLTGCPGPVTPDVPCTHENKKTAIETAATCTETGLEKIICADCGELIEENTIEALGHDFGEWTVTKEATCTADGEETRTCKREGCTHSETRPIKAHHSWDDGTVTKEATCIGKGSKKHTCTRCGETKTVEIAALEPDYQGGYCEREGCTNHWQYEESETSKRYTIDVFTSESAFNNVYGNQANTNTLNTLCSTEPKKVKFSFNEPITKISLNSLLHLKNDYLDYKVKKFGINGNSFDYTDPNKEVTLTYLSALLIEPITNE